MFVRSYRDVSGEVAHCVHVGPIQGAEVPAGMVGTLCGALLRFDRVATVAPGVGMPCSQCVPVPEDAPLSVAPIGYEKWGWPVVGSADRVLLILGDSATALALPVWLVDVVRPLLIARDRPAPVLVHPGVPEHRIVLVGEPFGAALPWPDGVHTIGGAVPLPPTVTALGQVCWQRPPHDPDLATCREIDVFAAVRTALRDVARVGGGCS
ncbi:MAG: hypothetical protein GEU83_02545 [Pseudonocardiaceae bacterium]|nr:hypothetical protein [Pseudonocardiaceae bacterium]